MDGVFNCIRLHRDDIESIGFDTSSLTVEDMQRMAEKVGEMCMDTWWVALEAYCEELELPNNSNGQRP